MKLKCKKENLIKSFIFILSLTIIFLLYSNIMTPAHLEYNENYLNKIYSCNDEVLEGGKEQGLKKYKYVRFSDNIKQYIFWMTIYFENVYFDNNLNLENAYNFLIYIDYIYNNPKLDNINKVFFSKDRVLFLKEQILKKYLTNNKVDDNLNKNYELLYIEKEKDFFKKNPLIIVKINNYLDKNNIPQIEKNASYGSIDDAMFLYDYYKNYDEDFALAWLQIAAENGSDLAQRMFYSYLKNTNKVYSYTNTNYDWFGNETYKNFHNERAKFWEKIINKEDTDIINNDDCIIKKEYIKKNNISLSSILYKFFMLFKK